MTDKEKRHIDALYQNCLEHIDGTDEAWRKAFAYFRRVAVAGDQDTMRYAVRRIIELEDELEAV